MARKASIKQARTLRRRSSVTEDLLWQMLRNRKFEGLKFRRQVPMGPYVLDFLCLRHRLVVEAGGPFHDPEHDAKRDAWLASQGFKVLRFTNSQIHGQDHRVMNCILAAVGQLGPVGEF